MLSAPVLFRTMILARNSVVENESNPSPDGEKCLDSQLWHACAGGMVRIPPVNSRVFYFPQGQVEHAQGDVDFRGSPPVPPFVLCRVVAVQFKADRETDEVYARIRLLPVANAGEDDGGCDGFADLGESLEMNKPTSFAKTLTQSDANNGGGFSVPRYCAETIFPRLDYTADPPVQTVLAKDVHGEVWKIRHIYRGTPRRHLLTTGWSTFVNQKRLVAGDSIVFLRTADGELYVGIRRAARGELGSAPVSGWNPIAGGCGYGVVAMEIGAGRGENGGFSLGENMKGKRGMVNPESVAEAASLAARGLGFDVVYYPRGGTPEFCVRESSVSSSMGIQWTEGMRFKMAFETEDSSRISWFMGTISGVQVADPIRWPNSPWRLLQVTWDEPDLLQNAKRVSPWLVEVVSSIPNVQMMPFPPHKKLRLPNRSGFPLDTHPLAVISGAGGFRSTLSPLQCLMDDAPSGIQGARHGQFGFSLSNLHLNHSDSPQRKGWGATVSTELFIGNSDVEENVSCSLAIGISPQSAKKTGDRKPTEFILFGQPIFPISDQKSATSPEEASTDVKPERI